MITWMILKEPFGKSLWKARPCVQLILK
jgi:hypothetical protein